MDVLADLVVMAPEVRLEGVSGHGLVSAAIPQSTVVSCMLQLSNFSPYHDCANTVRGHSRAIEV